MKTSFVLPLLLLVASGHGGLVVAQTPGTFTATGNMTTRRYLHTATLLADGRVLIAGGERIELNPFLFKTLSSAELYDPLTGTFSVTGDMTTPRFAHGATLRADGKVLITGGAATDCCPPQRKELSAELYDPDTGTFSATGDVSAGGGADILLSNGFATEILLQNGKVLLAGGASGDAISSFAELFDPITGTFAATGSMIMGREAHTATLLPDGTVLFVGGNNGYDITNSAEIYDPVQRAFRTTASMPTFRESHTATLLNDGTVLIAGGDDGRYWIPETILSSVEIYTPYVLVPAPVLLSLSGDGRGQGAIQHANTVRIASASDPAVAGEYLSIYLTGLADGGAISPQIAIGGRLAEVTFFGNVPGYPGLDVINIRMPSGVGPGPAVPVRLTYLGRQSNQVSIGAQ